MSNRQKIKKEEVVRLYVLLSIVVICGLGLASRLFFIQIVEGGEYAQRAVDQYARPAEFLINRGDIYLSQKESSPLPVAATERTFTAYINPRLVEQTEETYNALSEIIELNKEDFIEKASKDDPYEILARNIDEETAQAINGLRLPGVATHDDPVRSYPAKNLAAHTVGFMSYSGDTYTGTYGIERSLNEVLAGPVEGQNINMFAEVLSGLGAGTSNSSADVILTIDSTVQGFLEKQLETLSTEYDSQQSGAIIMDPQTGEIIAMAAYPTFDVSNFSNANPESFNNPNVEEVFEMGSIIKPLTIAAGLDSNAITPNTHYQDDGTIDIEDYTISNYDGQGRGWVDMQTVLNQSLNTGVAYIADQMSHEKFRSYFEDLFGETTNINLPSESQNLIDNLNSPRNIEYATAAFGQGIALTPLSTARALAALGNGGLLVSPHVVKEIQYENGDVETPDRPSPQRVFTEETSETISRMLVEVYDEALRGGDVKIDTHTVAAKTGTAQIANEQGGYSDEAFLHSFFGYFPAYDPEFLVLFYTDEPQGVEYASDSLTDPFVRVTNFLIDYYSIPPDR